MAYPFGPPIPFMVFIQRLQSLFGCEVVASINAYRDTTNHEVTHFRYLVRMLPDGERRVAGLPNQAPTIDAMPTVIRSICTQLSVDYGAFGVLSDPGDDEG